MTIINQPVKIYSELEQLIYKYEGGFLPESTILHAEFGKFYCNLPQTSYPVWLVDHQTGSVFVLNKNNILFVAPLVETKESDKPEKRIYNDKSNGKRYTWLSDDFSQADDNCVWHIKQRHKLITMQLLYVISLKTTGKIDSDMYGVINDT